MVVTCNVRYILVWSQNIRGWILHKCIFDVMQRSLTGGGPRAMVCLKSHLLDQKRESWRQDFGARTPPGSLGWTEASSGNIIKKISFANSPNHSHKNSNKNMLMWLKTGHHTHSSYQAQTLFLGDHYRVETAAIYFRWVSLSRMVGSNFWLGAI